MSKKFSHLSALALLLLSLVVRTAIGEEQPLPPLDPPLADPAQSPEEPEAPSIDCSKLPKALWHRTPACAQEEDLTIAGCLDNVVAGTESGLTPACDAFLACFEAELPTAPCLKNYPNLVDIDGDCVQFAGTPLVCLVTSGDVTVGIAPGQLMPQEQEQDRPIWSAVSRLIPTGSREEKVAEASEAIYDHRSRGGDGPLINRSFGGAYSLYERLVAEKGLPDAPELLYVLGTVVEDRYGKRLITVEVPKNGGECELSLADRFRQADALDPTTGKKLPKATRNQREANRVTLAHALAPLIGIPTCRAFVR